MADEHKTATATLEELTTRATAIVALMHRLFADLDIFVLSFYPSSVCESMASHEALDFAKAAFSQLLSAEDVPRCVASIPGTHEGG
jgi:hypothetical protein